VNKRIWAKARSGPGLIYILAGMLTWPLATMVLYWGDRFTSAISSLGQTGTATAISVWAACGYSFLISMLIMAAGWVQSARSS
jgi:hypothetical protein